MRVHGGSLSLVIACLFAGTVGCTMVPVEDQLSVDGSPEVTQMNSDDTKAWKIGIRNVLRAHSTELKRCWDELRHTHGDAEGKVVVEWRINVSGKAENVRVTESDPLMEGIQPCLAKRFSEWTFPTPSKPVVADIKYPLYFRR